MWINVPFVLTWTTHSYFSLFYFNNVDFHFKFDIWQINAKNLSLKENREVTVTTGPPLMFFSAIQMFHFLGHSQLCVFL